MPEAPLPSQTAPDPWYVLYFKLDLEQHLSKCCPNVASVLLPKVSGSD
jgi:hypothetical protein